MKSNILQEVINNISENDMVEINEKIDKYVNNLLPNKIIVISDIHGRTDWKDIVNKTTFTKCVFIGDYFDSFDIQPQQQKSNFLDIIKFKEENPDRVILLLGNHDYHYLSGIKETYSGYQMWQKTDIGEMLDNAVKNGLIQMCFKYNNYLFTHAGITKTWLKNTNYDDITPIDEYINALFKRNLKYFKFTSGINHSNYGDDICQSPIWVRPNSLLKDGVDDFIQIVGHTEKEKITILEDRIYLTDTMETSGEFLSIENNTVIINNKIK